MIWTIVSIALIIILTALTGFFFLVSVRATQRADQLEFIIIDTLDDMENAAEIFDQLVNRRSLLSDDPDIQRIKQVFGVTLDILKEYIINGKRLAKTQEEATKEKEK